MPDEKDPVLSSCDKFTGLRLILRILRDAKNAVLQGCAMVSSVSRRQL